ncbi:MAG TPA: cytochrome c-type biogenesis protein [Candidatus Binatia bacterium]|nr:cytochrome c-type biogenesis protein [Candidatus Binatia bacterium]
MRRLNILLTLRLIISVLAFVGLAVASQYTPEVEREAARVTGSVMSPFCPGRLISDCPSPAAIELREQIRKRIAAGETAEAIKAELLETYGEFVRAAPTAEGFDLAAWLVPPIALALATVAVMLWMRRRGAKVAPVSADAGSVLNAADKARIEAELEKGEKGVRPL